MFEFFVANGFWIVIVLFALAVIVFTARRLAGYVRNRKEVSRRLAQVEAERKEWLAAALVKYRSAIAARDARNKDQPQGRTQPHPRSKVASTEPAPAPTVPLPPHPPANTAKFGVNSTIPLVLRTDDTRNPPAKQSAPQDPAPPRSTPAPWHSEGLKRFQNLRFIDSGGFADVLYGEDAAGQPQAIKVLRPRGLEPGLANKLFRREARMLAVLRSPSIPRLISSYVDDPLPHFTMEYIEGLNLRDHVQACGPLADAAEILALANSTADALSEIHAKGFLHRDIKPLNVMRSASGFKLIDLGVGKDLQSPSTSSVARMGTLAFMAPEYMNGHEATTATDVFSWGAMMGFSMTGLQPYGQHPEHILMDRVRSGRLDNRFLEALEDVKRRSVTHRLLIYVVIESLRITPTRRDTNFREVLRALNQLH